MEGSTVPKNTKNSQDSIGKELVLVFGLTRVHFLFFFFVPQFIIGSIFISRFTLVIIHDQARNKGKVNMNQGQN